MAHAAVLEDEEVTTKAAVPNEDNLDIDFGDEKVMAKTGLQKVLPVAGKVARVNLLADFVKPKMAWTHFIENKGSFRCLSKRDESGNIIGAPAICCTKTAKNDKEKAQLTVAVLALEYLNVNREGKLTGTVVDGKTVPAPIEYDIKWVKLSKSGYAKVSRLPDEDLRPYDIDIFISVRTQGFGFDYSRATTKAVCRRNPDLLAEIKLAIEPYLDGKALIERLGKKVTAEEMAAILSGKAAASSSEVVLSDDVDDI